MNIETLFNGRKIIPVVTIERVEDCERIFGGLADGGLLAAEVCFRTECAEEAIRFCFRTECAEEAIRYARKTYPKMLVGAGTVIDGGQCRRALGAGAQFIVSPGLSEDVALLSAQADVPYLPGTVTPTGIMRALALGIDRIKFFPACNFGGLAGIKSLSAAFLLGSAFVAVSMLFFFSSTVKFSPREFISFDRNGKYFDKSKSGSGFSNEKSRSSENLSNP